MSHSGCGLRRQTERVMRELSTIETSDRGYVLENGRITLSGPAAELARNPRVIEAYLGGG